MLCYQTLWYTQPTYGLNGLRKGDAPMLHWSMASLPYKYMLERMWKVSVDRERMKRTEVLGEESQVATG